VVNRRVEIIEAALAVAQQRGLAAMSMRAVAEHLGASVMGLYRHVPTKEALLDGLVGRLAAEIELPDPAQPWDQRLHHLARDVFDLAARYPTVVPLLLTRAYRTPDAVRLVNATSAVLRDAGVPHDEIPRLERMVSTFLLGFATSAANRAFWSDPSATSPPTSPQTTVTARLDDLADPWRAELDRDVEDLVALLQRFPGRSR
jgi:AcrR family transcriptional regulator